MSDAARPRCFLKVSRLEAQLLLERYPECGNLLLRPSGDGTGGVSVTTLQKLNGCACAAVGRRGVGYRGVVGYRGGVTLWVGPGRGLQVESLRAWVSRRTLPGAGSFLKVESFEGLVLRREPRQDVGWSGLGPSWGLGPGEGRALPCPQPGHALAPYPVRTPVVRHYKVKREGAKYVIDVEEPVSIGPGPGKRNGVGCTPSTPALIASPL